VLTKRIRAARVKKTNFGVKVRHFWRFFFVYLNRAIKMSIFNETLCAYIEHVYIHGKKNSLGFVTIQILFIDNYHTAC
jgi:hypothetical protein